MSNVKQMRKQVEALIAQSTTVLADMPVNEYLTKKHDYHKYVLTGLQRERQSAIKQQIVSLQKIAVMHFDTHRSKKRGKNNKLIGGKIMTKYQGLKSIEGQDYGKGYLTNEPTGVLIGMDRAPLADHVYDVYDDNGKILFVEVGV